jgi:hypothetical protein
MEESSSSFLSALKGKSGVYLISPEYQTMQQSILVKIGLSRAQIDIEGKKQGGLGQRLDSYLLCYPRGFHIFGILQTQAKHAYQIEKWIHNYFTSKGFKSVYNHSRVEEWYYVSPQDVYVTLETLIKSQYKGFICKHNIYIPPLYLDSNGREAQHPKQPLSEEAKREFEAFISPDKEAPKTIVRQKQYNQEDDMMLDNVTRTLNFV